MTTSHPAHRIAVIAGDGIGKEVVPEGLRALEAAASAYGLDLRFDHFVSLFDLGDTTSKLTVLGELSLPRGSYGELRSGAAVEGAR